MENKKNKQIAPDETPKSIGMEYLLLPQRGDREIIDEEIKKLSLLRKEELVDTYNHQVEIGIVGVRGQSLRIFALSLVFKKVFGKSPVSFKNNMVLGLTGKIELQGEDYVSLK